ncbi:MAG: rhodanese-like domain-containing protein [Endozoicomonas sp. (ex Botrylloides leachii)]|nr:rhodanese-like domain-containing protein [Endozoicomonas sp. (ex Botrylloides leachii)]
MKWMYLLLTVLLSPLSAFYPAVAREAPVDINGVITINSHQAKKLYELGAPFIDVRPEQQWRWGRIEGAHNLDLQEGFKRLFMAGTLNKELPLVIYGNSSYHMRGAIASYLAALWGYEKIFFFRDGYFTWLALDYPVSLKSDITIRDELSQVFSIGHR